MKIVSAREQENHDVSDYFLSLSSPVSILLRERAVTVALQEILPEIYQADMLEHVVTLKEAWRWTNLSALSKALGLRHATDSHFHINLTFSHAQAQQECRFLYSTRDRQFSRRKNVSNAFNLSNVKLALSKLSDDDFRS